jgi:hypothetical protein
MFQKLTTFVLSSLNFAIRTNVFRTKFEAPKDLPNVKTHRVEPEER